MPILIKVPSLEDKNIKEWAIVELQGDLEVRGNRSMCGQFIGDLSYNKYGQPILIIGHHILTGRESKFEKPLAVLEKKVNEKRADAMEENSDAEDSIDDTILLDGSTRIEDRTVLDTTVAIENKTRTKTEYLVRAIVKRKLIFKARPKPIIANIPDHV